MRILVTVSRDWTDRGVMRHALIEVDQAMRSSGTTRLIEGGAGFRTVNQYGNPVVSCDLLAADIALELGWEVEEHPAEWLKNGAFDKLAGFKRNQEMVDSGADICVAFLMPCQKHNGEHYSHGATDCVSRADKAGIPVKRYYKC